MELREVTFDKAAVATLTVNRPAALNALNRVVLEDIAQVLSEVRRDAAVRVLIVTGAGDRAFVAGADIAAMSEMAAGEGLEFSRMGHRVMQSFEDLPIPVIAAVNGFALGGGLELAMACDLIIASEKARFGQPEINLALIPGFGGTQRLPHRIGHARAREFVMTGDMFDAKTALALGLVNQVVAPDRVDAGGAQAGRAAGLEVGRRIAPGQGRAARVVHDGGGRGVALRAGGLRADLRQRGPGRGHDAPSCEKRDPKWQHK